MKADINAKKIKKLIDCFFDVNGDEMEIALTTLNLNQHSLFVAIASAALYGRIRESNQAELCDEHKKDHKNEE